MRLGYYYHIPAKVLGKRMLTLGTQGRFIDSLSSYCDRLVCFLHSSSSGDSFPYDYEVQSENVGFIDLGRKKSAPFRTFLPGRSLRRLSAAIEEVDALLIRGPSPLLPPLCSLARQKGIVPVLLLVGNYIDVIPELRQPAWRKAFISGYLRIYDWLQKREIRRCPTFVNSRKIFEELKGLGGHIEEVRTTTLTKEDFYEREDTCEKETIRIIYAGRYDVAKGLKLMVGSLGDLRKLGVACELHFAGWDDSAKDVMKEVRSHARELGIENLIKDHGYIPIGPELWKIFRECDIFINASQAAEGFPRTIWEAMANCLPVVATDVGSIRAFAEGAVELVKPRDQNALTAGIESVIRNGELRRNMIERGYLLAKSNTLQERSKEFVSRIERVISARGMSR